MALAAGLAAGLLADAVLGDPRRGHPVAGFGQVAGLLERLLWRPSRTAGAVYAAVLIVPPAAAAGLADRWLRRRRGRRTAPRVGLVAATGWAVLGAASLRREAVALRQALPVTHERPTHERITREPAAAHPPAGQPVTREGGTREPAAGLPVAGQPAAGHPAAGQPDGGLAAARARLPHLCGREPTLLDETGLVRATIESVAENTSDAAVAPLFWGALAGPAGLVGYRAVNTLDAMVGHRSERHRDFGWAAARLDDLANLGPARLTAGLATVLAPAVGGRPGAAWRAWRRDAAAHPSPNAGPCEATFAGALGVRLGGPTTYSYGQSNRPWLGTGRDPSAADIDRAVALSRLVTWSAAAICVGFAYAVGRLVPGPDRPDWSAGAICVGFADAVGRLLPVPDRRDTKSPPGRRPERPTGWTRPTGWSRLTGPTGPTGWSRPTGPTRPTGSTRGDQ